MEDSELLARIDERVVNLDNNFVDHEERDTERFSRSFKQMEDGFAKVGVQIDKMDVKIAAAIATMSAKIDVLWDARSQQHGAVKEGSMIRDLLKSGMEISISAVIAVATVMLLKK